MNKIFLISTILFSALFFSRQCLANDSVTLQKLLTEYESVMAVPSFSIPITSVVSVPIERPLYRSYLVVDEKKNDLIPSFFSRTEAPLHLSASINDHEAPSITDGDTSTGERLLIEYGNGGEAVIELRSTTPFEATGVRFISGSAMHDPVIVGIQGTTTAKEHIVLRSPEMVRMSQLVSFIPTNLESLTITLRYDPPHQLNEVVVERVHKPGDESASLRFLAQPGASYRVYEREGYGFSNYGEMSSLAIGKALHIEAGEWKENSSYVPRDEDGDGISDTMDNCPSVKNPSQTDEDTNGIGDACEDFDRDGVLNSIDNCRSIPNVGQFDKDQDGFGDECDDVDNRITVRYSWLSWVALGATGVILLFLFYLVATGRVRKTENKAD